MRISVAVNTTDVKIPNGYRTLHFWRFLNVFRTNNTFLTRLKNADIFPKLFFYIYWLDYADNLFLIPKYA